MTSGTEALTAPPSLPRLQYAAAPPWHRRHVWSRALFAVGFVCIAISAARWLPALLGQAALVYWQNRCAQYSASPEKVVFSEVNSSTSARGIDPAPVAAGEVPRAWNEFYARLSPPGLRSAGTAFLHTLRNGSGERLVAVDVIHSSSATSGERDVLLPRVIATGSWLRPPREIWVSPNETTQTSKSPQPADVLSLSGVEEAGPYRVFAGQIDPADASHFTIRFESGDRSGVVDGWLRDDDTVLLSERGMQ